MGYQQYVVQQVLGQSHAIGMVSLERGWANSKPPVALPWSNSGPIPCYWPCLLQGKLGQSHAISIVSLVGDWPNSTPFTLLPQIPPSPFPKLHSSHPPPIP